MGIVVKCVIVEGVVGCIGQQGFCQTCHCERGTSVATQRLTDL